MKMKKLLSAFLTASVLASFAVIPAHASGFSSANISSSGYRDELKGNSGSSSNYSREQTGSGASRVVLCTMKKAFNSRNRIIDNATGSQIDAHFVHARTMFSIKQVGSEKIVFRINAMNPEWSSNDNPIFNIVVPSSGGTGYISAYGGTGKGVSDNDQCFYYTGETGTESANGARDCVNHVSGDTPEYQVMDLIFDCEKGYAYCYIDGRLIVTHTNAIKNADGVYRGYSIIGSNSETVNAEGTKLWVKFDPERPGETVYVDTDDYTVRLEDVILDAGLATTNGDPHQIMESAAVEDYIFAGTFSADETITYERRDSNGDPVSVTAEKVKADYGNVSQLYGGVYHKDHDWPGYANGKGVFRVSFDQKINAEMNNGDEAASDNYSFRLRAQGGKNYELLYMSPEDGTGKMKLTLIQQQGDGNTKVVLDKDFNDTIHYDMVFYGKHYSASPATDAVDAMGYYFVDGQYIGSYKLDRGSNAATPGTDEWWTPTQLYLYSNNTANVTYSNYKIAVYDENKDAEELVEEIRNENGGVNSIYWQVKDRTNGDYKEYLIDSDDRDFAIITTPKTVWDKTAPQDAKVLITLYKEDGQLFGVQSMPYETNTSTGDEEEFGILESNGNIAKAKLFVWDMGEMKPLSSALTVDNPVPEAE